MWLRGFLDRWRISGRGGLALALGLGLGLAGCEDGVGRRVVSRAGEIHLHQDPSDAHVEALFVDPPTPIAQTEFDSALPSRNPPLFEFGDCKVYGEAGCAGGACPAAILIDGGRVEIDGLPRPLSLSYQPQFGGYDALFEDGLFIAGGSVAHVRGLGAKGLPAFSASIEAPLALASTSTLDAGLAAGLEVAWTPVPGDTRIKLLVNIVPNSGLGGAISCELDEALGRFCVPDAALALLPPPPRTVQLELSRYRLVDAPLGDGRAVIVHSGYSVLSATTEP